MSNDDIFITSIHVEKVRNLENFDIPLSEEKRQHLIITGKNGSGKTSLLNLIDNCHNANLTMRLSNGTDASWFFDYYHDYLKISFNAKRTTNLKIPRGIEKIDFEGYVFKEMYLNTQFVQYIVNLKAERSFARDDNDNEAVKRIDAWFERFENQLKILFDAPDLSLVFDRQNYNFHIQIGNNEPFAFNELSDGYSAVISIVTELILRMEATGNKAYDQQGIVLIDEIETHLHVALQKKIMPFLCDFFPNVQFIVTTHSPFVLSSISNAVICDLETKEIITDLSGYSYTALVESYFDTDKYSQEVKNKITRFEELSIKDILNEQEEDERDELKHYFNNLPKFYADELEVKLQQIRLQTMARKG